MKYTPPRGLREVKVFSRIRPPGIGNASPYRHPNGRSATRCEQNPLLLSHDVSFLFVKAQFDLTARPYRHPAGYKSMPASAGKLTCKRECCESLAREHTKV